MDSDTDRLILGIARTTTGEIAVLRIPTWICLLVAYVFVLVMAVRMITRV